MIRIISWNVNGIRAVAKKGFNDWLARESPDILCIQETKAHPEQLDASLTSPPGYQAWFSSAERKGYSGVAIYSKLPISRVEHGFGEPRFDREGRVLIAHYADFTLFNIYYPNGKQSPERLAYKLDFYRHFLGYAEQQRKRTPCLIITGDFNTAHREIDIARPKDNEKTSGFLPVERSWMDEFIAHGYVDTFRRRYPDKIEYSWWDYKTRARERNIGWRIDYFFMTEPCIGRLHDMVHQTDMEGSDHCPLALTLDG